MSSSGERFTDIEVGDKRLPACHGFVTWKLLPIEDATTDLRDLLPEINTLVKSSKSHCSFPNAHNLSKDEAAAIYLYTMEMSKSVCVYRQLNQALRSDDRYAVRPWFAYLKLFSSGISKLPNVKDIVWRGVQGDLSKSFKRGQQKTWWSVTSCSTSLSCMQSFLTGATQSTLFSIQCSTARPIADFSAYPIEHEVILMPGTKFVVASDPIHHEGGLHIVHLKEIVEDEDCDDDGVKGAHLSPIEAAAQSLSEISLDSNSARSASDGCRPCPECGKCNSWRFTGNQATWNWIRAAYRHKWQNKKDADRWYKSRTYNLFERVASCSHDFRRVVVCSDHLDIDLDFDLNRDIDLDDYERRRFRDVRHFLRIFLRELSPLCHICLCDR